MRSNSAEIWMTPILQYLLITLNASKFENSLFVIRKIFGLFCNTLTAGQKYSLLNRDNLMQHTQTQLSLKQKNFSGFFSPFLTLRLYFQHIQKKTWPSQLMHFRSYGLRKPWFNTCLKSPVSEDISNSNMVNGPKHCWNLTHSTFSKFIDQCESNRVGKSLA